MVIEWLLEQIKEEFEPGTVNISERVIEMAAPLDSP
jgi:hypothetical protein